MFSAARALIVDLIMHFCHIFAGKLTNEGVFPTHLRYIPAKKSLIWLEKDIGPALKNTCRLMQLNLDGDNQVSKASTTFI